MVRISDARMSGTAYGTVVLHTAPEAAVGGPLALVKDGDWIELDVAGRRLEIEITNQEMEERRARSEERRVGREGGTRSGRDWSSDVCSSDLSRCRSWCASPRRAWAAPPMAPSCCTPRRKRRWADRWLWSRTAIGSSSMSRAGGWRSRSPTRRWKSVA